MKKIFTLFAILFFSITLFSQSTFYASLGDTPVVTTSLWCAQNLDILTSTQTKKQITITRFTPEGVIKWSKTFTNNYDISIGRTAGTADNGFVIAGFNNSYTFIFLIKCDSIGKIMWQKKIWKNYNSTSSIRTCGAVDGSTYIATSDMKNFNEVFKVSNSGFLLWRKCYTVQSARGDTVLCITSGKDSSVTIGIGAAYCVKYCSKAVIQQFDKNGNLRFSKRADTALNSPPLEPVMLVDNDINIQAILYSKPVPFNGMFRYVDYYIVMNYDLGAQKTKGIKVTPAGDLLLNNLRNRYDLLLKTTTGNEATNLFTPDGSLYQISTSYNSSLVILQKYNSQNSVCGNIPYWKTGLKSPLSLKMIDYPFALLKDTVRITGNNATSAKYEETKVYCSSKAQPSISNENITQNANQLSISVYPNPAKNIITIIGLPQLQSTSLTLVNAQGIVLKNIIANKKSCSFNISALPRGMYFIKVVNNKMTSTIHFIKE